MLNTVTQFVTNVLRHTQPVSKTVSALQMYSAWVVAWVLWLFVFVPLAWIGMWTVLSLFTIGIIVAFTTRFPGASILRLLIPTGDYGVEATAWLQATLSFRLGYDFKPQPKLTVSSPTGEPPTLRYVQLRSNCHLSYCC